MDSSPFDFDVVTGPPLPRDEGSAKPRRNGDVKPDESAEPAGGGAPNPPS